MQNGFLTVSVIDITNNKPITDANVNIYSIAQPNETSKTYYSNLKTNLSGQVSDLNLDAPDLIYSLSPSNIRPYSEYVIEVSANGYETAVINGAQILPTSVARQTVPLIPMARSKRSFRRNVEDIYDIEPHTLWGNYPPKIPEDSLKPMPDASGFVVLDQAVVPEYIVVHDGLPTNSSATDYWIPFKDYIKNVASSEVYSTWPTETIYANVIAIVSFTLNRVFT